MNKDRFVFLFLLGLSLVVHFGVVQLKGFSLTQDFQTIYDPLARQVVAWVNEGADFPKIHGAVEFFHLNYVFFVAAVYLLFGIGNYVVLISLQIILASFSYLVIFDVLRKHLSFWWVAIGTAVMTFIFFESVFLNTAGSPESLYRSLLILAYFPIIQLYLKKRYASFFTVAAVAFLVLLFIRIETVFLFLPCYALSLSIISEKLGMKDLSPARAAFAIVLLVVAVSLFTKTHIFRHEIFMADRDYFIRGIVVADLGPAGRIEPFDTNLADSVTYVLERGSRLFVLRVTQFLNIFPPSWSAGHKIYYAAHMVPFYILFIFGVMGAWRRRDFTFLMVTFLYVSAAITHGLTRVDAAHRTNFISIVFLVMLAGYGLDQLCQRYLKKARLPASSPA
jgi:hypothetical protein